MPRLSSVLLVDDDPTANFLHRLLLTRLGVAERVVAVTDGQQALDALDPPPALILLDLNMPVLNGFEFLERYQAVLSPAARRPVVALLSSSEQALDQARTRQLPADAYLTKPLTREQLQELLAQHFADAEQ